MKLFVTGGTGFIGANFLAAACSAGHEVFALRRPGSSPRLPLPAQPRWLEGGLDDDWTAPLGACDALVHFAAAGVNPADAGWEQCFETNVTAALKLWRQASDSGVRQFVVCGSCFEYGRAGERYEFIPTNAPLEPTGPYHASKAAATMAALGLAVERQASLRVLRPFHVFGPGEAPLRFWPALVAAAQRGDDFPMTAGAQVRDFVPVAAVAAAFLRALRDPALPGEPVIENLGSGQPQTLRAFAESWWRQLRAPGELRLGALPYRPGEVMRYVPLLPPPPPAHAA